MEITVEALREALSTGEGKELLTGLLRDIAENDDVLDEIVESRMADEREAIRREVAAQSDRKVEVRDLRDHALR